MTEQTKRMMKMIMAVILILAVPALFFQTIGENPMEIRNKSAKAIAVVNEENGSEGDLGKEVFPVFKKDSSYEWIDTTRSEAENGLKNDSYDAVVYIPSDFTENIMTYESEAPEKAEFNFKVKDQLTAVDKEKVLGEIKEASDRASKTMSIIYWDSIAQEMDDVKEKFDDILEKEENFQATMVAFYKPSSKGLAEEIQNQQEMLQQLQGTMADASKEAPDREQSAEELAQSLEGFLGYVNDYRDYRENQISLMNEVQQQSLSDLQNTMLSYTETNTGSAGMFAAQTNAYYDELFAANESLNAGNTSISELERSLQEQSRNQETELQTVYTQYMELYQKAVNQNSLTQLQQDMQPLRAELEKETEEPETPDLPDTPDEPGEPDEPGDPDNPGNPDPDDPGNPDEPGNPDNPGNPNLDNQNPDNQNPDEPGNPDDPGSPNPDGPNNPDQPGNPDDSGTPGNEGIPELPELPEIPGADPAPVNMSIAAFSLFEEFEQVKDEEGGGDFGEQRKALTEIENEAKALQETLNAIPDPKPQEAVSVAEGLGGIAEKAKQIEQQLSEKNSDGLLEQIAKLTKEYETLAKQLADFEKRFEQVSENNSKWKEAYGQLLEGYEMLSEQLAAVRGSMDGAVQSIEAKERAILESSNLSEERRTALEELFENPITNQDTTALLQYYAKLDAYDETLKKLYSNDQSAIDTVMGNENLDTQTTDLLKPEESVTKPAEDIKTLLPSVQLELSRLEESLRGYVEEYNLATTDAEAAMMEEIAAIQTTSTDLLAQIQSPGGEPVLGQNSPAPAPEQPAASESGLVSGSQSVATQIGQMNSLLGSLGERQSGIVTYTDELFEKVDEVQEESDELNAKWAANVEATEQSRDQIFDVLSNTDVDGQDNGYVYEHLASPIQISGDEPIEQAKSVPPVVILVIVMLTSLLIGFFSTYFKAAPIWLSAPLFILLNIIAGLIISLFGADIYSLPEDRAIQWSIFTILLLLTASSIIRVAYMLGNTAGMLANIAIIALFVSPLLSLTVPNFTFSDPMSAVYISIQEDASNLFTEAALVLGGILVILTIVPIIIKTIIDNREAKEAQEA
ncbi:type VII secretion protein EsaA [Metabacillus sp. 113a]|uniref:type VII secretion protein EsaA n=1 Tax=Metabacillus sp. 113a TaxID=3404706 RepID=UPI003CF4434B